MTSGRILIRRAIDMFCSDWAKWLWFGWFVLAGSTLLTDWAPLLWLSEMAVYLFAGTLCLALSLCLAVLTCDSTTRAFKWVTATKEQREQQKAARKARGSDAPTHWEPPMGRD